MEKEVKNSPKLFIRACHRCGHVEESSQEMGQCSACKKWFLPITYSQSESAKTSKEYKCLFLKSEEMEEQDLIVGITVIWD